MVCTEHDAEDVGGEASQLQREASQLGVPVRRQAWVITALETGSLPADFHRLPAAGDAESGGRYAGSALVLGFCTPRHQFEC